MTKARALLVFTVVLLVAFAMHASTRVGQGGGAVTSVCGDSTGDGVLDISDAIHLLSFLFTGGPPPAPCEAQSGNAARDVSFDPTGSGLSSLNVQAALLELDQKVRTLTETNTALLGRLAILESLNPSLSALQLEMVQIPAGAFLMGSPVEELNRVPEETLHPVTISKGFSMAATPVTQALFESVTGYNPSFFLGCPDCPVVLGWFYQAQDFLQKLTQRQRAAGVIGPNDVYRLPTEAEWEYSCRAGTTTRFSFGNANECSDTAFCALPHQYMHWGGNANPDTGPRPVGKKSPNPWGLYDMHGNVEQLCSDWVGPYPVGEVTDPKGPSSGPGHVLRGGGIRDLRFCRSAFRNYRPEHEGGYGFRFVLAVAP